MMRQRKWGAFWGAVKGGRRRLLGLLLGLLRACGGGGRRACACTVQGHFRQGPAPNPPSPRGFWRFSQFGPGGSPGAYKRPAPTASVASRYAASCPWLANKPRIKECALEACAAAVNIAFLSSRKILIQFAK